MKDAAIAKNIHDNCHWFHDLYRDLADLVGVISEQLKGELGYMHTPSKNVEYDRGLPDFSPATTLAGHYTLPDPIIRYHRRRGDPFLTVVSVLSNEWPVGRKTIAGSAAVLLTVVRHLIRQHQVGEPMLMMIALDHDPSKYFPVSETSPREYTYKDDGSFQGKLDWGKVVINFSGLLVPLDKFRFGHESIPDQGALVAKIRDNIIEPLKSLLGPAQRDRTAGLYWSDFHRQQGTVLH